MEKHFRELLVLRADAHRALLEANRALKGKEWSDKTFVAGREALDVEALRLSNAKWLLGTMDGTYGHHAPARPANNENVGRCRSLFSEVLKNCALISLDCERNRPPSLVDAPSLAVRGETRFADGIPVLPAICPVVVLQGSDYEMGYQYAQQVVEIYGEWIFSRQSVRNFSSSELGEISKWTDELKKHGPGILEFAEGMCGGLQALGLSMTKPQALAIWTGANPPAREPQPAGFGQDGVDAAAIGAAYFSASPEALGITDMCSGICAWGRATSDGALVAGSSTDHDCTFMATIVAYPSSGYPYIYTPFSANGAVPILGPMHMAGHPGMNAAGLAYVHHGGANTAEPREEWGYGIRRGAATMQILQHCASTQEAMGYMDQLPVGDAAITLGSAGGLFADARSGFSLEARPGAPHSPRKIVRRWTYDAYGAPYDFLYANNNAIAPESPHLNCPPPGGYDYSLAGGWFTADWGKINQNPGPLAFRRMNARNSEGRNRYAYRKMMERYGQIDINYMSTVYRTSGFMPNEGHESIQRRWMAGERWELSTAHRANAYTSLMKPSATAAGSYWGCVGPADRFVEPRGPEHGYFYFDETNVFMEMKLEPTPEKFQSTAVKFAEEAFASAERCVSSISPTHAGRKTFQDWLTEARVSLDTIASIQKSLRGESSRGRMSRLARIVRLANVAQVRARQIMKAVGQDHSTAA